MKLPVAALLVTALASACVPLEATPVQTQEKHYSIVTGDLAQELLIQCSRGVPPAYDGQWPVTDQEVARLENLLLTEHVQILRNANLTPEEFLAKIERSYAGFTREGKRYVYGSFGPVSGTVCDGGPRFFGVEFEMPSGRVTHDAYNGLT